MSEEFLTVSEMGNFIRDVLKAGVPRALWVCGEIQELREKNNHMYFTLSEKDEQSNQVVAKIGATIWANQRFKIEQILKNADSAFVLKEDIQVKVLVKVDFYPPFGQVRLIVESIDPVYTLGKIAQDRLKLIAVLKAKGILDANKRLSLPDIMLRIGLITSYNSAAYHDFTDELRKSGYGFKVFLVDALMQGKNAAHSVVDAIRKLNELELDVIVVTRGGGSVAELSCFDSEEIARAVSQSRYPVISGIGHEINTTITDLAAHTFAKTPTAVARLLILALDQNVKDLEERQADLIRCCEAYIKAQQIKLKGMADAFKRSPVVMVKLSQQRMRTIQDTLKKTIHLRLAKQRDKINQYHKLIAMADPKNTLKRGFSITRTLEGKALFSAKDAKRAKVIETTFVDGAVTSQVVKDDR